MRLKRQTVRALWLSISMLAALGVASSAQAARAPHWMVISQPAPTYFHAGDTTDFYWIVALNDGGAPTAGKITLKDTLPAGLSVAPENGVKASAGSESNGQYGQAVEMECATGGGSPQTIECTTESSVPIGDRVIARIDVEVPEGTAGPLANMVSIAGGGAPEEAETSNSTPVVDPTTKVPYGFQFEAQTTQENGHLVEQAASHPFAFSTLLAFNISKINPEERGSSSCEPEEAGGQAGCAAMAGAAKDVEVQLPPGFVGNPLVVPRCTQEQFQGPGNENCPASTQVGGIYLSFYSKGTGEQYAPVYNIEPPPGQPAELGFTVGGQAKVPMFFHVRSDGDYGLTASLTNIANFDAPRLASLMIWGVPAAEAHNPMRDSLVNRCEPGLKEGIFGCPSEAIPPRPFLTMPSVCDTQPINVPLVSDSWQEVGTMIGSEPEASLPALGGCENLSFEPEIGLGVSTHQAGAPAGYQVNLKVPQTEGTNEPATPDVRDVEVQLPLGTVISPSAANGLSSCSDEKFGAHSGTAGECPLQSKVGTVTIHTPLLAEPLEGNVYVGRPECGASGVCSPQQAAEGKMVRLFVEAKMPEPSPAAEHPAVLIKLAGRTMINQSNGRLTTVFEDNPQLPFEALELELEGGPDAPLVNPRSCGAISASAHLAAWSALFDGEGNVTDPGSDATIASSPVAIENCSIPTFSPGLMAGMRGSSRGGSFGSFVVTLSRPDGQQDLGMVTLHTPPGLSGMLAKVPLCDEARANAGSCDSASEIGEVTASVGVGTQPYTIRGGRAYLTEKYGTGSFGLSLVIPAEAGPYRLAGVNGAGGEGNGTVVVRGSIEVDPKTASLTIATNPPPTHLDGIPLHLQKVIVNINREGFMFNPTNCEAMKIEAAITSSVGATASSTYPFQATDCATLPFKPGFAVSTRAHHSRRNGAALHVTVTSSEGQANIKSVFVELPKMLPSRTETLKLACSEAQFAANPAGCPAGSNVGMAVAHTPLLPVPLTGPAIFVSHGGAKFPDLDVVLQGSGAYGVTVILTGHTNIGEKSGITSSNFDTVPDVPVSSFELTLPEGPHSVLAATGNLCTRTVVKRVKKRVHGKVVHRKRRVKRRRTLIMPTTITGQNGAVIKQSTKIAVSGCGKK